MQQALDDELLTSSVAARLAGVASATIRLWADRGRLPAVRTSNGMRLYRRADVLRVKAQRLGLDS